LSKECKKRRAKNFPCADQAKEMRLSNAHRSKSQTPNFMARVVSTTIKAKKRASNFD